MVHLKAAVYVWLHMPINTFWRSLVPLHYSCWNTLSLLMYFSWMLNAQKIIAQEIRSRNLKKKKLIRNEYWISIDPHAQNLILHKQSQAKICKNMFDMQAGKTDANKWEQGAVWGSRVKNMCCLFLYLHSPTAGAGTQSSPPTFFSNFRASVIDKTVPEGF